MKALGMRFGVVQDRDKWWRVTINGRVIRSRRGAWNLYQTQAGALSGARGRIAKMKGAK